MRTKRGSILIFTLWVLLLLIILGVILSYRASSDVKLAKYEARKLKLTYLAKAGIFKMLTELAKDTNSYDSLNEDWNRTRDNPQMMTIHDDRVLYGASDENRRLNLNSNGLKKVHLLRLGLDDEISENILKYRDKKGDKGFEFIEELFLVEGMNKDIFDNIKDFITIYRGRDSKVNINTAGERVLMAIIGDSNITYDIMEYRRGPDRKEGTEDDGIFRSSSEVSTFQGLDAALWSVSSDVFRIWAKAILSEDKDSYRTIEAVMDRTGRIYHWKEF